MRKAFDANVPRLKPRLRTAIVVPESLPETAGENTQAPKMTLPSEIVVFAPVVEPTPETSAAAEPAPDDDHAQFPTPAETPPPQNASELQKEKILEFPAKQEKGAKPAAPIVKSSRFTAQVPSETPASSTGDAGTRRERLEKVKRKVAEAARAEVKVEPVPEDPAQAAESVLGLVSDLETQLSRTRDMEKALRTDLAEAKGELARAATEGRTAAERLGLAEAQLEEKRKVLEEMLAEMNALEEERDQAVRRAQMMTAQDEDRCKQLDDLGGRCAELERVLAESQAEGDRLSKELDESLTENAQLRAALSEVTRERDGLARNVDHLVKERDDLTKAKNALEKVHQALAQARARLGN
jgi:DNA repair exonuclease SbcCD ATPase subunit